MIALDVFKKILEENGDKFPLLTLDEFFDGNSEEDSIAPNQWEDGRPTLDEMWKKFREIEKLPNVAWVRVALHDDTEIVEEDGMERLNLVGDSIIVCTDMEADELENIVDCDWLCSDGVTKIRTCFVLFLYTGNPRELSMSGNCVGLSLNWNLWKKESIYEFYRQGIGRIYKW